MRTIYYKEAPENPESLKVLLKDYFDKQSPITYWSDTKSQQCDNHRDRSVDDMLLLANRYFPGTTIKEMMNAYVSINEDLAKDGNCMIIATCSTIQRVKFCKNIFELKSYGNYLTNGILYNLELDNSTILSEWSMRDLEKILQED